MKRHKKIHFLKYIETLKKEYLYEIVQINIMIKRDIYF